MACYIMHFLQASASMRNAARRARSVILNSKPTLKLVCVCACVCDTHTHTHIHTQTQTQHTHNTYIHIHVNLYLDLTCTHTCTGKPKNTPEGFASLLLSLESDGVIELEKDKQSAAAPGLGGIRQKFSQVSVIVNLCSTF